MWLSEMSNVFHIYVLCHINLSHYEASYAVVLTSHHEVNISQSAECDQSCAPVQTYSKIEA